MRFSNVISSNAIIQSMRNFIAWGYANPNEQCSIRLFTRSDIYVEKLVAADSEGLFEADFGKFAAGFAEYTLEGNAQSGDAQVTGLLFGEVFIAAGQSNMSYAANCMQNREELRSNLGEPYIRYVNIFSDIKANGMLLHATEPQKELKHFGWKKVEGEQEFSEISGLAYMVALQIFKEKQVPIGIYNAAVGGSAIDTWLAPCDIKNDPKIIKYLKVNKRWMGEEACRQASDPLLMMSIFKEKIAPLLRVAARAVLWYQGENSACKFSDAKYHCRAMQRLITGWRREFCDLTLPFINIHIATHLYEPDPFACNYINEGLDRVEKRLKNVTSVPIYDINPTWLYQDESLYYHPIHPIAKEKVAQRVAKVLLNKVLGKGEYGFSGLVEKQVLDGKILVRLDNVFGGLKTVDGLPIRGFSVGANGHYVEADAQIIENNQIMLSSKDVPNPTDACYAYYLYNENANLVNGLGLPVKPFRSKYEDATNQKYYTFECFTHPRFKQWVCCYYTEFGCASYHDSWNVGKISDAKVQLTQVEDTMQVQYVAQNRNFFFFGASPIFAYPGAVNPFSFRNTFRVEIDANGNEFEFFGLLVQTHSNKRYMFRTPSFPLKLDEAEFRTIEISLKHCFNCAGGQCVLSAEEKRNISYVELVFRAYKDGKFVIRNAKFI